MLYYETIRDENGTVLAVIDDRDERVVDIFCSLEELSAEYPDAVSEFDYELMKSVEDVE